jgi:hypothetical protein
MILTGETEVLGEKPVPVPIYPPKVSHGLTWDRIRSYAVTAVDCPPSHGSDHSARNDTHSDHSQSCSGSHVVQRLVREFRGTPAHGKMLCYVIRRMGLDTGDFISENNLPKIHVIKFLKHITHLR